MPVFYWAIGVTQLLFYASSFSLQFTTFINKRSLILSLTLLCILGSIILTPYFWQEYHFSFTPLLFTPTNFRNAAKG